MEILLTVPDLVWVLLFAIVTELISIRLRVPSVLGMLTAGMLIGPYGLQLVSEESIGLFAEIGAVMLLFSIGISFSIEKLLNAGLRIVITSLAKMGIIVFLVQKVVLLLGYDFITAIIISFMFMITSTAILVRLLQQKHLIDTPEAQTMLAMLILEDIAAIFALAILSGLENGDMDLFSSATKIFFALIILAISYVGIKKIFKGISNYIATYGNESTLIFFSIFIALFMSSLTAKLGLSTAIGAFLAGSLIVSSQNSKKFEEAIKPFDVTLSSFFFISIGMLINPAAFIEEGLLMAMLVLLVLVIVFFATFLISYNIAYPKNVKSSVLIASAMPIFGEFTLLIAKIGSKNSQIDTVALGSLSVLVSAVIGPIILDHREQLIQYGKKRVPKEVANIGESIASYTDALVSELTHATMLKKFIEKKIKSVKRPLLHEMILIAIYVIMAYLVFSFPQIKPFSIPVIIVMSFLLLLLSGRYIYAVITTFKEICIRSFEICIHARDKVLKNSVAQNIGFIIFLLTLASIVTPVLDLVGLLEMAMYIEIPLLLLSALFFWRTIVMMHSMIKKHKRR